jgi:hypothetical protein
MTSAQVVVTQIGQVVFQGPSTTTEGETKKLYADLCNSYIRKYYPNKKLPLIYLDIKTGIDDSIYELAYDNLNQNSLDNKTYERKDKYSIPGILIKLHSQTKEPEKLLKLLEYGIGHMAELRKIRNQALKLHYRNQPDSLSLNQEQLHSIINADMPTKIKSFLVNTKL